MLTLYNSEGYSVIFQVALTIIHMNKDGISKLHDPIEIFQILQNMPRRLIDCPTFMDVSLLFFLHSIVFDSNTKSQYILSDQNAFAQIDQTQIEEKRSILRARKNSC